jgi:transposase
VIRLHKKKYGVMRIVELTNLSQPAVRTAIDLYEAGGMAALTPKARGRKSGDGRSLTPEQEAHIRKLIADRRPVQLKMVALWTRAAVSELIMREFKIALSVRGIGKYSSAGALRHKSRSRKPTSRGISHNCRTCKSRGRRDPLGQ